MTSLSLFSHLSSEMIVLASQTLAGLKAPQGNREAQGPSQEERPRSQGPRWKRFFLVAELCLGPWPWLRPDPWL